MSSVSNINDLSNLMKCCVNSQESFIESMNPVKEIINSTFESMPFKDERTSFHQSATPENVKNFAESFDSFIW